MPPSQRCSYECDKSPTGPLNRKKLIEHINKQALETPDIPELKPYVPGVIRGKKVSIRKKYCSNNLFYQNVLCTKSAALDYD